MRCDSCHAVEGVGRAPSLAGIYGTTVATAAGDREIIDESYLRTSILDPKRHVVSGYESTMPTFQDRLPRSKCWS